MFLSFLVLLLPNFVLFCFSLFTQNARQSVLNMDDVKVPVQLGVMSRCPDALICENIFDQVLTKVANKVDISLIYIANIDPSEPEIGVTCKHGREECVGNIHQLCVQKYTSFAHYWEYLHCTNFQGIPQIGLPQTAYKCAKAANIDWDGSGIGACTGPDASGTGEEGISLLKDNVLLGKQMGLKTSCTVVINGEEVCIHDGGDWRKCNNGHTVNDFVRQINDEYNKLNAGN
ncbi:secreted protein [Moniliophthora roreri MCA 2997]|uniref:Secreted protein n=1 Tax=Moniliophthora roreri (strain MCA 2997) TaxID=1381753 RepID=V2XTV0_MONRO|nr:secreted protein [Moniliophthora roreri MCA 2997]